MWTLSGFADEISPDLEEQCQLLDTLGIRFIELRSAWDTNVLDLDDDQVGRVRKTIAAHGISLSSVGSPIGKISVRDDFEPHLARFRRAVGVAEGQVCSSWCRPFMLRRWGARRTGVGVVWG